ncbi:GTP cyclohydrolase II [Leuconostoc citreum]|uniref:GTP cyclohydrolase II n=1 Tax=Leuconostoc citreum TaxID=33964 RepID=UPI0032DF8A7E
MLDNVVEQRVRKAVTALKQGAFVILTDDQNREHKGDLVGLASFVTPERINSALTLARGVLAVPMSKQRADKLGLRQMTDHNSEKFATQFIVSVDHIMSTTGVSAFERAKTIRELANLSASAEDFETPGHVFPLVANEGGVLSSQGHTEGAVELAKIAGVPPIAYIIEILDKDGQMAREKALESLAEQEGMIKLAISDIVAFKQAQNQYHVKEGVTVNLPSTYGSFQMTDYDTGDKEPALLIRSQTQTATTNNPLVRLHSECATGDIFGSYRCDCGPQLQAALRQINEEGGALLYLSQEGRGIGLAEKLKTYVLQENNYDTYEANVHLNHAPDERDYQQAAEILKLAGLTKIRLLTNNPDKINHLKVVGIEIVDQVPLITGINDINKHYLATKRKKFKHIL